MILLSQTYEIITDESAEIGDVADRGFDFQDVPHTFKGCVHLIKSGGFTIGSESSGTPHWLSTESTQDYYTGEYESKSLHPALDRQSQRYWDKACQAAGIC